MPVTASTIRLMRALVVELDAVIDRPLSELARAYGLAWDTVSGQLRDSLDDLVASDSLTATNVQRSSRIASALQVIADQLDGLAAQSAVVITDALGQVTSISVSAQAAIAGSQLPAAGYPLVSVNPDVIGSVIARTATNITARTRPLAQAGQVAVRTALIQGASASDHPTKVARNMVRLAKAGAVDLPMARATAIARTELLDSSRAAQHAWDQANAATLQGWEWLSSRSKTTCASCWAKDGTIHELSEEGPLDHVCGRCTRMVRTKTWRELGIDLPEPAGLARISAEDHFKTLSPEVQQKIMGPGRLKALNDGAPWSSLATLKPNVDWRPSWQITPVRDLLPV